MEGVSDLVEGKAKAVEGAKQFFLFVSESLSFLFFQISSLRIVDERGHE